jgi:hypothetical protein
MKPRHAAALALVGWYLVIFPDEAQLKKLKYPPQYLIWDTYSDKASCERDRPEAARNSAFSYSRLRHTTACVRPDDPSLKGKYRGERIKP